jgi:membrane protein
LLFGASGVFAELRDSLNIIWDAQPTHESGLTGLIKQRLVLFGMVLSVGFLLLVSLLISAGLALLGKFFSQLLPLPAFVFEIANFAVSFLVIAFLFALLFKFVPARQISWQDVRIGAIGTAILFTLGKSVLGFYLGKASVGSAYGAAGSLVAVIVWVYYSAQIFFFGAQFTRVYADTHTGAGLHDHNRKAMGNQDNATREKSRNTTAASSHNLSRSAPATSSSQTSGKASRPSIHN